MRQSKHEWRQDAQGWRSATAHAEAYGSGQNYTVVTDVQTQDHTVFQVAPDGTVTVLSSPSTYSYASVRSSS